MRTDTRKIFFLLAGILLAGAAAFVHGSVLASFAGTFSPVAHTGASANATALSSADASANFEHAQTLYAAGDIVDALKYLALVVRANPSDASAHYLKANCLVLQKRFPEAVLDYLAVEKLMPKSKLAAYSETAVARIKTMPAAQASARQSMMMRSATTDSRTAKNDSEDDDEDSVAEEKISGAGGGNASVPAGTIETIRKQAAQARARHAEIGRAEAEGEIEKADNQVKALQERAAREAAHAHGGTEPTAMSSDQLEATRSQTAKSAERLREQGQWKAEIKQWEAQEKVDELKQQAENLEHRLLHDPVGPVSDVRINPIGTNLYTRNYASVPSKLVPLRAQAKTLTNATGALLQTTGSVRQGNSTNPNEQTSAEIMSSAPTRGQGSGPHHVVSTVKGQVVRK